MGSKSSCQGALCDREAEIVCSCQVRLCRSCYTLHRLDRPPGRHIPTHLDLQSGLDPPTPHYTLDGIKLVRTIRSSEAHAVHEGVVLNTGASVIVSWKTFRSESEYKRYQQEAEKVMALSHKGLNTCLAHYLDDSYQDGYRYVLVFEGAQDGDMKSELRFRLLTRRKLPEKDLQIQLRQALTTFTYLQKQGVALSTLQLTDFFRINDSIKFCLSCDLTDSCIHRTDAKFKDYLRLSVQRLASIYLQLGHLSEISPGEDMKSVRKSLFALECSHSVKTLLSVMLFGNLDFKEVQESIEGVKVSQSGLLSVRAGSGYLVSTSSPQLILCPKLQPSASIAFLSPAKVIITGGQEKPTSVFHLKLPSCCMKQRRNMNDGRMWHSSLSFDSTVLVAGGRSRGVSTNSTEIRLSDKAWSLAQTLTTPREAASITRYGKAIYLCGGISVTDTSCSYLVSIEIFETGGWKCLDFNLSVGLAFSDLVNLDGELVVLGGLTSTTLSRDIWKIGSEDIYLVNTLPQGVCFRYARWGHARCALAVQSTLKLGDFWQRLELSACLI